MTALYVLTNDYLQLAEKLADGDFDAQTVADTIEASGIKDELAVKAQGIEFVARGAEAHNFAIDAEIARLEALKAHRSKTAAALRQYLKDQMERAGIDLIECPLFKVQIKKNPPSVDVIDQLSLPKEFWRTPEPKPPVAAPDKARIKEALQHGDDVPGARLTQSTRLVVA
jgi:hypothetical protein